LDFQVNIAVTAEQIKLVYGIGTFATDKKFLIAKINFIFHNFTLNSGVGCFLAFNHTIVKSWP